MARRATLSSTSLCIAGVLVAVAAVACGSSSDSTFGNGGTSGSDPTGTSGSNTAFGGTSGAVAPPDGSSGGSSGGVGAVKPVSSTDACANSTAGVDAPPIYLVFMVDRSGSMGGNELSVKWTPAVAALKDFFKDPSSANIHASLTFFQSANLCSVASYATPGVPMQALPDATTFAASLDGTSPNGNTPTRPAVEGAVQYAQSVAATLKPGEKVAIVLVTDGDPNDNCSPQSSAANTAAAAATVAGTIKTYVVGVGNGAANLDQIATGGGTAPHIQVNTTNAATTSADLRAAIGKIKAAQLSCDYTLPPPPAGKTIDVNAVNVNYTTGGAATTLGYSADCSNASGWHYDSTTTPTKIIMCPTICSTLQNDTSGGKVDIVFGCSTAVTGGGPPPSMGPK
jgi:Mg-chelatase subunit ChlD